MQEGGTVTNSRVVVNDPVSRRAARTDFEAREMPFIMLLQDFSKDRSLQQDKLAHAWYRHISKTTQEDTPYRIKGFCKLHFGVPILRGESDKFCEMYDRLIKPASYEWKIDIMSQPDIFPVTSLLTTSQMSDYMTDIQRHYASRPTDQVQLNFPEDLQ